ncbi:MAG: pyrimidine 5'-nucleotidase [Anaerolineae bacterium]|nr:MAG: pyrimidine 5'-nucleotidase [Anaerolineae bacterium]
MYFTTLFFDVDDTLYPASTGLWEAIRHRIDLYMHERLGIPWEDIPRLRQEYFEAYGTTLRGIEAHYKVDKEDYLAFVHDLPLEAYLKPDPELRAVLESLPTRNLIFTNADAAHARRVLAVLQLEDCFDGILDVHAMAPYAKPQEEAFRRALELAGERDPHRCVLLDDIPRTTRAARRFGFFSILVGVAGPSPDADATLTRWRDLPALLDGHHAGEGDSR